MRHRRAKMAANAERVARAVEGGPPNAGDGQMAKSPAMAGGGGT